MLGKCAFHEVGIAVRDVEVNVIETEPLDLVVDRAGNDVARRKLGAFVELRHEALAAALHARRKLQLSAFAADRLGDQEILDLEIVEASRVELHELHVGDAAACPPRHGDPVAGRAPRRCRIKVGAPRAAARQDGGLRGQGFHAPGLAVVGVEAVHRAARREVGRVAAGDEVDRDHVGHKGDVGVLRGSGFERLLDCKARSVGDVDDAPVAMPAFTRQVQRVAFDRERYAQLDQMRDRARRGFDNMLDDVLVVQPCAGDHRIVDVRLETVAFVEHRGDPALCAAGRALRRAHPWR